MRTVLFRVAARGLVAASLLWAFGGAAASADDKLPSGEQVLDTYVEKAGGKAAFEKLKNRVTKGKIKFEAMGVEGPFIIWQAEPNLMVIQVEAEGIGKMQEGSDGQIAWAMDAMQGARVKEGNERAEALRQAIFNGELHWRKVYKKAETQAIENVNDKPAYKVLLTPAEGNPATAYYDKETGLITKISITAETAMGAIPVETYVSDYRPVDGVLVPHKLEQKVMQQNTAFMIESIEHNVEIPKTRFELPIEVRQVQDKVKSKPATGSVDPEGKGGGGR